MKEFWRFALILSCGCVSRATLYHDRKTSFWRILGVHFPKVITIQLFFFPFIRPKSVVRPFSHAPWSCSHSCVHSPFSHRIISIQNLYTRPLRMHESCRKRHYVMFSFFSLLRCRWMCLLWFQRWVTVSSGYHNSDNDRYSVEKGWKNCSTILSQFVFDHRSA